MGREPHHVLLVEDNPGDADLLRAALAEIASAPFRPTRVDRLAAALSRLGQEPFEAVLLDLDLPDSQGLDTFLLASGQAPAVPVVVLTGRDDEALALKAVHAGAQDYLVKGQVD